MSLSYVTRWTREIRISNRYKKIARANCSFREAHDEYWYMHEFYIKESNRYCIEDFITSSSKRLLYKSNWLNKCLSDFAFVSRYYNRNKLNTIRSICNE